MPFTLAHPAAVLPLHRRLGRWASLSSLVVGSLAPDFAYFLPLGIPGSFSHSLPGLFVFCLPVGLVVWGVYLAVLRPFFLALLPRAVSERLAACASRRLSLPIACGAAASVVAGAATHLVWDSFTHSTGFMVRALPALSTPVHLFDWYSPRVYTLLQHASTLGGLAALAVFGLRWYRSTEPRSTVRARPLPVWPRLVVLGALLLPGLAAGLRVLRHHLPDSQGLFHLLQRYLGRAIVSGGTVFLAMLVLVAIVWRAWETWLGRRLQE
jgi:hypothetical protein